MQHLHNANTLEDMRLMAREITLHLDKQPIVLLKGELGAGKTTLAQMICEELGVKEPVTSPTYTIANEYFSASQKKIYHFDLYRLQKENELDGFGFLEYLDSGNICLIEWPEIAENYLSDFPSMEIIIQRTNEGREILIRSPITIGYQIPKNKKQKTNPKSLCINRKSNPDCPRDQNRKSF